MGNSVPKGLDFEAVKTRLAEIADAVGDDSLSLDDALDLYEEAVALGLQAGDLLETGIDVSGGAAGGDREESKNAEDTANPAGQPGMTESVTGEQA